MRFPEKPPLISDALQGLDPERIQKLLLTIRDDLAQRDYAHWDELRRYKSPEGLDHRQWWGILKLFRLPTLSPLALTDRVGVPFKFSLPESLMMELQEIDILSGGGVSALGRSVGPVVRDRYLIGSLVEEAITSSQMEGAVTTREIAKEMIRSGRPPHDRSERMILNNYRTMQHIRELKETPLTPEIVFDIHRLVTEETLENPDDAGRFRAADRQIDISNMEGEVFHLPPRSEELQRRLELMCDFANRKAPGYFIHPIVRAIILHFWLAYDHPFVDGNGRAARALFYWSLLRDGYWIFEYVSISRILKGAPAQYLKSFLYTETDDNDLTYFLIAQAKVIHRAVKEFHDYINRIKKESEGTESKARVMDCFNQRQSALIRHALKHPGQRYTIEWYSNWHQVVYQTARTDLLNLKKRKVFKMTKNGKQMVFSARQDLEGYLNGADSEAE